MDCFSGVREEKMEWAGTLLVNLETAAGFSNDGVLKRFSSGAVGMNVWVLWRDGCCKAVEEPEAY
jgi:hypothetical protein